MSAAVLSEHSPIAEFVLSLSCVQQVIVKYIGRQHLRKETALAMRLVSKSICSSIWFDAFYVNARHMIKNRALLPQFTQVFLVGNDAIDFDALRHVQKFRLKRANTLNNRFIEFLQLSRVTTLCLHKCSFNAIVLPSRIVNLTIFQSPVEYITCAQCAQCDQSISGESGECIRHFPNLIQLDIASAQLKSFAVFAHCPLEYFCCNESFELDQLSNVARLQRLVIERHSRSGKPNWHMSDVSQMSALNFLAVPLSASIVREIVSMPPLSFRLNTLKLRGTSDEIVRVCTHLKTAKLIVCVRGRTDFTEFPRSLTKVRTDSNPLSFVDLNSLENFDITAIEAKSRFETCVAHTNKHFDFGTWQNLTHLRVNARHLAANEIDSLNACRQLEIIVLEDLQQKHVRLAYRSLISLKLSGLVESLELDPDSVRALSVADTRLSRLPTLHRLKFLDISDTDIYLLEPVASCPIDTLTMHNVRIADGHLITGFPLYRLNASRILWNTYKDLDWQTIQQVGITPEMIERAPVSCRKRLVDLLRAIL